MGRKPLRSSLAPTNVPSEKTSAAGPSHGSLCCESDASAARTSRESSGSFSKAGGTIESIAASAENSSSSFNSQTLSKQAKPRAGGELCVNFALFGAQPATIGNNGVDFAVVRDVAERLRQMPGRLRVGRIALL